MSQRLRYSGARLGTVVPTALSFAVTALLLVWIAFNSLHGPHAGSTRRTAFAIAAIALALLGFAVAIGVIVRALRRRRRLREHLRPGEEIVGLFSGELVDLSDSGTPTFSDPRGLTLTNQRLLLHEPEMSSEPSSQFEHEEIISVGTLKPISSPGLRRCLLQSLALEDQPALHIRMAAATAIDFIEPRDRYLNPGMREMRGLVVSAEGPTPSRPEQSIDSILVQSRPTICLLELGENYLRVVGEHSPPLADLYHYFHWEHMQAGELQPARHDGLPDDWQRLTLRFHEASTMTLCGTPATMRRLRQTALSRGASPMPDAGDR